MTVENDFLVWAASGGNVMTQANYAANAGLANGVATGIADPTLYNKSQRQASIIMAMIADFIVAQTSQPAIDDGTTATLLTNFEQALRVSAFPTGLNTLSATTTLTAVNAGTYYNVGGTGTTQTLNSATFAAGQTVGFLAQSAFTLTASSGEFYGGSLAFVSSVAIPANSLLALQWDGVNWRQLAGSFVSGHLLNVQTFAGAGTYTPTAGTNKIRVTAVGGGGAGGGAVATASSTFSVGSGGASGSPAQGIYTSGFAGAAVTVGAAGNPSIGNVGGSGGTTSFGALLTAPGGGGGGIAAVISTSGVSAAQGLPGAAATGGTVFNGQGNPGACGIIFVGAVVSGQGASSTFSGGGPNTSNGLGIAGLYGAGGSGAANQFSSAAIQGGAGGAGFVVVEEFS